MVTLGVVVGYWITLGDLVGRGRETCAAWYLDPEVIGWAEL